MALLWQPPTKLTTGHQSPEQPERLHKRSMGADAERSEAPAASGDPAIIRA